MAEVGMDAIQSMERALLTDVLEASQLQGANAFFSLNGTLGRLLGYALGACTLTRLPLLRDLGSQTQILFLLAAAILFATTALTVLLSPERQFVPQLTELFNAGLISSAKRATFGAKSMPKAVRRAFASNLLNWSGWAILFFFASDWMAVYIFDGDSEDVGTPGSAYERGVQAASLAYLLMAAVGAVTSLALAALCQRLGFRRVWVASLLWASAVFLGLYFVAPGDRVSATALVACLGVPLAASYQLPWVRACVHACLRACAGSLSAWSCCCGLWVGGLMVAVPAQFHTYIYTLNTQTCVTLAVRRSEDSALFCTLFRMSEVIPIAFMGLFRYDRETQRCVCVCVWWWWWCVCVGGGLSVCLLQDKHAYKHT
jgi:hypothetical protein